MKSILIFGGDKRLLEAKKELIAHGFCVNTMGLETEENGSFENADIYLLPVPSTRDGKTVYTPLTHAVIPLSEIEKHAGNRLVLGCKSGVKTAHYVDYGELDEYCLLNAVPTAEGAVKIAIENTDFTLWRSRVLVIGYGRVGKILASRLQGMGCRVTISARKASDFALAEALHYRSISTESILHSDLDYDIVFNTVDHRVIDASTLQNSRASLFIDLATQNGFDPEEVRKSGKVAIKAPGLPGKIAPATAGKILARTVVTLINQHYAENH